MLLGFKKRFAEPIKIGTKVFTMRGDRKVKPKIGETLYMYSGLRTKNTELISNKEKLISRQEVRLMIIYYSKGISRLDIHVDGRELKSKEIDEFVKFDGFKDRLDFVTYWIESSTGKKIQDKPYRVGGLMNLYHWTDLKY